MRQRSCVAASGTRSNAAFAIALVLALAHQPWWPAAARWTQGRLTKVFGPLSVVFIGYYAARIYGVPRRTAAHLRHPVLAPAGENVLAMVQDDQAVFSGQTVMYTTAYADPNQACH